MDPNKTLTEIRALIREIQAAQDSTAPIDPDAGATRAVRLAELVDALDGRIKRGGCLPDSWKR